MSIKKLHREIMLSSVYQLSTDNDAAEFRQGLGRPLLLARWSASAWTPNSFAMRSCWWRAIWTSRSAALGGSDAGIHAAHGLWQSQPLQAGRVSPAIRFSRAQYQRGKAIHHHGSAAAPVPDEQRLHAGGSRSNWPNGSPPNRTTARASARSTCWPTAASPAKQEIKLGLDYLHAEPMREYEENKNKPPEGGPVEGAADGAAAEALRRITARRSQAHLKAEPVRPSAARPARRRRAAWAWA